MCYLNEYLSIPITKNWIVPRAYKSANTRPLTESPDRQNHLWTCPEHMNSKFQNLVDFRYPLDGALLVAISYYQAHGFEKSAMILDPRPPKS